MNPEPSAPAAAPAQPACALALQWLGRQDYGATWDAMRAFTNARNVATPDQLWGVEHPPVFTLGQAGKPEHLLAPHAVPVVQTDRGGQVTFHGPGQSVIYLLLDIRRHRWMVRDTVQRIEEAVIRALARWGIAGQRKSGAPGIYLSSGEKISALGLKVRNGCTYHGVAINVAMDLEPFTWINPCGYPGLRTIDMASLGVHATVEQVAAAFAEEFAALWQAPGGGSTMTA
ncbi:MAG: lipoyl(octanoyl) transferase LipB [Burkholderiaceae bacterium]|nr:lipoyl(octanoyl) transferase LipB [Burkholderiaceae bacterium]